MAAPAEQPAEQPPPEAPGYAARHSDGIPDEKRCSKCRRVLPAARFYRNRSVRSGLQSQCKGCGRKPPSYWPGAAGAVGEPEEWRPVVGFEGWYEVSSLGRVRRVGRGCSAQIGRILKGSLTTGGYRMVQLSRDNAVTPGLVHRLVAAAFLGPCPEGHQVNHRDRDKRNNRPGNLEYVTQSGNMRHAYETGLRHWRGSESPLAKLHEGVIPAIRASTEPLSVLAARYGVTESTILKAKRGETWRHVEEAAV